MARADTSAPELLDAGAAWCSVAGRDRRRRVAGGHRERPLMKLDGIDDRETAAGLRGRGARRCREPSSGRSRRGSTSCDDLIGCEVTDGDAARSGWCADVLQPAVASTACEVERHDAATARTLLVPLVGDAVALASTSRRGRIDVDLEFVEGVGA